MIWLTVIIVMGGITSIIGIICYAMAYDMIENHENKMKNQLQTNDNSNEPKIDIYSENSSQDSDQKNHFHSITVIHKPTIEPTVKVI